MANDFWKDAKNVPDDQQARPAHKFATRTPLHLRKPRGDMTPRPPGMFTGKPGSPRLPDRLPDPLGGDRPLRDDPLAEMYYGKDLPLTRQTHGYLLNSVPGNQSTTDQYYGYGAPRPQPRERTAPTPPPPGGIMDNFGARPSSYEVEAMNQGLIPERTHSPDWAQYWR